MKTPLRFLMCTLLVVLASVGVQAETKAPSAPPEIFSNSNTSIAGTYVGKWTNGSQSGMLRLTLKQQGATWSSEVSFTYEDAPVPAVVQSVKVDGPNVEVVCTWDIQGTPGRTKLMGQLKGQNLAGTYENKTPDEDGSGTWTATRS